MMIVRLKRRVVCLVVLLACASLTGVARAGADQWRLLEEHWYVLKLGDVKAGWMQERVESNDTQYRTVTDTLMRMNRMNAETQVRIAGEFIETHSGEPVSMASAQTMSAQRVQSRWVFKDDGVHLTVQQGDRTITDVLPTPQVEWLPPQAADRYYQKRREAKAEEIAFRSMNPEGGFEVVTTTSQYVGEGKHEIDGRSIPVTIWSSETTSMPVAQTEKYSTDDVLVYWEANLAFGRMSLELSTKDEALRPAEGGVPELLVSSFVEPSRPIPNHMSARQARYRLRVKVGDMPDLPTAGAQRASRSDDVVTLLVNVDDNVPATEQELAEDDFRSSSSMVDSSDPLVQKLAQRALRGASDDPLERADRLRRFTYSHIRGKGMETAFASASETARTRTGDCSEHAVLLAALLRADGIPSRLATGLVYIEPSPNAGVFGWHMWTQALIDGRWIDLDATLPGDVRYHAGHVLTSTSSFSDTSGTAELGTLFMLIGNLEIDVLETAVEPATTP